MLWCARSTEHYVNVEQATPVDPTLPACIYGEGTGSGTGTQYSIAITL